MNTLKKKSIVYDIMPRYITLLDDDIFEVRKSQIKNAGKGLYTTVPIQKGEYLMEYKGKKMRYSHNDHDHDYCYGITEKICLNAADMKHGNKARFINDASGYSIESMSLKKKPKFSNNLEWKEIKDRVFIKALKYIPENSELYISYGDKYWKTRIIE